MRLSIGSAADKPVVIPDAESFLNKHLVIFGPTGSGKSTLMASLEWQQTMLGRGTTVIDVDSKTADDQCTRMAENWETLPPLARHNLHYIKFTKDICTSLDLSNIQGEGKERDARKAERVKRVLAAIGRSIGIDNYNEQQRRLRVGTNIVHMCLSRKSDGTPLGLHRALEVIDAWGGRRFEKLFNSVNSDMDVMIAQDCWHMHTMNRRDRDSETASTRNLFYNFLQHPLIRQAVSNEHPAIDIDNIVFTGGSIKASLDQKDPDVASALASLLLVLVTDAAWYSPTQHSIFVEEAHNTLGEYLVRRYLSMARKHGVSFTFSFPNLSCLNTPDRDMRKEVLDTAGSVVFFQTRADADIVAKYAALPTLDFTERERPTQLQVGYQKRTTKAFGSTAGTGTMAQRSGSDGGSTGCAIANGEVEGGSWRQQWGLGVQRGETDQEGSTQGESVREDGSVFSYGSQKSRSTQNSASIQFSSGIGGTYSTSATRTNSWLSSFSDGWSKGTSSTDSRTLTVSEVFLAQHKTLWFKDGLETQLDVQYAKWEKILRTLDVGEFVFCMGKEASVVVKAHYMPDPYDGFPRLRTHKTKELQEAIWSAHPCYFVPKELPKWTFQKSNKSSDSSTTRKRWQ